MPADRFVGATAGVEPVNVSDAQLGSLPDSVGVGASPSVRIAVLAVAFVASLLGTHFYRSVAARFGIVAVPNERSLHSHPMPRGAGVAIAATFLAGFVAFFWLDHLPARWFLALFVGGLTLAVVGFVDDVVEVSARVRILLHAALAAWALGCLGIVPKLDFGFCTVDLGAVGYLLFGVATMWMINLYNFVDGIDGMAASGSVFVAASASVLLVWRPFAAPVAGATEIGSVVALLGVANLGFLCFNWPPARVFMGDTGSALQGYLWAVLVLLSMASGALSLWTWIILLGYFVGDTTTTTRRNPIAPPPPRSAQRPAW